MGSGRTCRQTPWMTYSAVATVAFFREGPRLVVITDFARGRFPGSRVNAVSLEPSPGLWDLSGSNGHERPLSGYSGGTAQVFDLLPFYPPFMEAP